MGNQPWKGDWCGKCEGNLPPQYGQIHCRKLKASYLLPGVLSLAPIALASKRYGLCAARTFLKKQRQSPAVTYVYHQYQLPVAGVSLLAA